MDCTRVLRIARYIAQSHPFAQWPPEDRDVFVVAFFPSAPSSLAPSAAEGLRREVLRLQSHLFNSRRLQPPEFVRRAHRTLSDERRRRALPDAERLRRRLPHLVSPRPRSLPPVI